MWESEKVGKLSVLARLTFIGLISMADDEGRGRGTTAFIRSQLHAYANDVPNEALEAALAEIKGASLAEFYIVDGCSYFCLPGWKEHQRVDHPAKSSIPTPPRENSRDSRENSRDSREEYREEGKGREGNGVEGKGREGRKRAADPAAIPPDLEASRKEIDDWLAYKKERGESFKPIGLKAFWKKFREIPAGLRRAAVDHSMANNYQGLFVPKGGTNGKKPANSFQADGKDAQGDRRDGTPTVTL